MCGKILQSRSFQNIDKTCTKKELKLEYSTQISILPFPGTGTIGLLCEQEVQCAWLLSNIADSCMENPLVLISALFIEHLLGNDWMMTTCKCQGLQATGKIQNSNALYKGSNFVSSGELLESLSGIDKSCYTLVSYLQWSCYSHSSKHSLYLLWSKEGDCCVVYIVTLVDYIPAKRLFNLEGTRIGSLLFLSEELCTDKYSVTILDIVLGCYTAGSHLIIGLERTIIHWHWTLDAASQSHTR